MIEVEMPDGTIVEFPEGTSREVMQQALSKRFGARDEGGLGEAVKDTASSFGRGLVRGAAGLLDLPGQAIDGVFRGAANIAGKAGASDAFVDALANQAQGTPLSGRMSSDAVTDVGNAVGVDVQDRGDTRSERIAGTIGEFTPGAGLSGANLLRYAAIPGAAAELAGESAEGKKVPEWVPGLGGADAEPIARTTAALASPLAATGTVKSAKRVITPNPADPARIAAANRLKDEGVQVTAGQRTGNQNLMYREDAAARTQNIVAGQDEQFTAAALKRIGVDASRATPDVMGEARDRIGGMFNGLAKRNSIEVDQSLIDTAVKAKTTYEKMTNKNNIAPLIANSVDEIAEAARSGKPISGEKYQSMRTDLVQASTGSDGALRSAAYAVRQALDDSMGRTLVAKNNVDDIREYAKARQQWKDYLAVENSVSRAGEDTALGVINARQMRGAAAQQGRTSYVTGKNDLGNLARDGNAVMPRLPQSGTQPRLDARTVSAMQAAGTGPTMGGLAYALTQDPTISAAAAMAGIAAPVVRNSLSASRPGQAYLGNQLMSRFPDPQASPLGLLNILAQEQ